MLQSIREKATGPLAWIIVGIISVPFAFFGIEAFQSGGGSDYAAKVNGEQISRFELDNRVESRYAQFQQMLGESFRPEMFDRAQLRQGTLEGMIEEELLRQHLEEGGYRISDARVAEFIASQEAFKGADGQFSAELYKDTLARQGNSSSQYEQRVREFLSARQFDEALRQSAFLTPAQLQAEWAWQKQTRELRWRRYDQAVFAQSVTISEDEIAALYEERKQALQTPERVRINYLMLDPASRAAGIIPSDEEIAAEYEGQKERFRAPETRQARHILLKKQGAAEDLRARLVAGELDFAAAAAAESEDPGSKEQGGDLGIIDRGVMVPAFEEAVFSLEPGVLSEPVQTQFGWHLIEVTQIQGGELQPLEEVREEIAESLRSRQARAEIAAAQDQLEQLAFENPGSLEPAAEALGLEILQSDWFTRNGGAGITASPAVTAAAFSDLVLESGENSAPLSVGDKVLVLRLSEREPSRQQTLDEVRDSLQAELRQRKAREALQAAIDADRAQLDMGTEWEALEAAEGVTVVAAKSLSRDSTEAPASLLRAAFSLAADQRRVDVPLPNGAALVEVLSIQDGDWAKAPEAERVQLRSRLLNQAASTELQAFNQALRADAEVMLPQRTNETAAP